MLISVILPIYGKEKTIKHNLENIDDVMSKTNYDYEIIAVIDGQFVDNSYKEARKVDSPRVSVFTYAENRGKGYALRYGISKSKGDYICFIDAGTDIDPNGISMLMAHMEWYNADIVVGSKRHPASKVNYPFFRKIYSWGYHILVKLLFGIKVKDTQTGLKVLKREVIEKVFPRMLVKAFAFDIELLAVAQKLGFTKIYEAPVIITWGFDGSLAASFNLFTNPNIRGMILDTLAVFYRLKILNSYDDQNKYMWREDLTLGFYASNTPQDIKFSIIIPVRSINKHLVENIRNLKTLNYENFEVLIILDEFESYDFDDARFKIIESGATGPAQKRNLAAELSSGDILAFLDDDAYPTSTWLDEAAKIFSEHDIYALGGPAVTPNKAEFLERMSGRVLEASVVSAGTTYRHKPSKKREIDDYPTVNLFVKREAFMSIGGFDTNFWPGEDTKLCLDLVKHFGVKFLYDPRPVVYHHRRTMLIPHLKQVSRYGRHRGQFARIFPETSRLPSYFVPSIYSLGLLLGPLLCLFYPSLWLIYYLVISLYLAWVLVESAIVGLKETSLLAVYYCAVGIFWTHLVYGLNFIVGFVKRPALQLKNVDKVSGNYIGG